MKFCDDDDSFAFVGPGPHRENLMHVEGGGFVGDSFRILWVGCWGLGDKGCRYVVWSRGFGVGNTP